MFCVDYFKSYQNVITYYLLYDLSLLWHDLPSHAHMFKCVEIGWYIVLCGNTVVTTRDEKTRSNVGEAARVAKQDTRRQNDRNIAFPHGVTCQIGLRKSYDDDGCGSLNTTTSGKWWGRARGRKRRKKSARRRRRFQSSVLIAVQYFRRPTAARGGRHYGYCIVFQRAKKCARDKMRETRQLAHQPTYISYRYLYIYKLCRPGET